MLKLRNIFAILTVCLLALISPMVVLAEANNTKSSITNEKKDDINQSAISDTTITFSKSRQIIPTSTPLLSNGVVLNATVTYQIEVSVYLKENGIPLVNKSVTVSTTSSASQVKIISVDSVTNNSGYVNAVIHVRGNIPFNLTATYGTITNSTTLTPDLNSYYDDYFYTTFYITALETDSYYTGSKISVPGLTGTYKSDFIADVKLQGSGKGADGKWIKYYNGVYSHTAPTTATGTTPTVGRTIAVDNVHIPRLSNQLGHVYIYGIGYRQAEDSGGAIIGHDIDVYVGIGRANITLNNEYRAVQYRGNNTWVSGSSPASLNNDTYLMEQHELISVINKNIIDTLNVQRNIYTSEDGSKKIYIDNVDYSRRNSIEIALVNNGNKIIVPLASSVLGLYDVEFLNNDKIAVTGNINPSLQAYEIFDLNTGELIQSFYGYGFTHDDDGNLFYVIPQPHFHNGDIGYNKIVNDKGDILYESTSSMVIRSNMSIVNNNLYFEEINMKDSNVANSQYSGYIDNSIPKSIRID